LEKTKSTPGAKVENHKFCASVHFRCVDEKVKTWNQLKSIYLSIKIYITKTNITNGNLINQKWSELVLQVRSVLKKFPTLQLTQGRKVWL